MMRSSWQLVIGMTALALVGALIWADRNSVAPSQSAMEPVAMSAACCEPAPAVSIPEPESNCVVAAQTIMTSAPSMTLPPLTPMPELPPAPTLIPDPPPPSMTLAIVVTPPQTDPPANAPNPLIEWMPAPTAPAIPEPPVASLAKDCEDTPVVAPPATSEPPIVVNDDTAPVLVNCSEGKSSPRDMEAAGRPLRIEGGIAPRATDADAPPAPFPWRFTMEMAGTMTQFEVRRGEESLIRVQCEALDFSSPGGGLVARGKVVVTGPCHEARCERLTLAWQSGEVALDGGVQLSVRHEGLVQMMRAETLTFRLGGPNQPVEFTSRDVQIQVQPKP